MAKDMKRMPEQLAGTVIKELFDAGILSGVTSSLIFRDEQKMVVYVTGGMGSGSKTEQRYFLKKLSEQRLLLAYDDYLKDMYVIAVYDFSSYRVVVFVYKNKMLSVSKGSFTVERAIK